jgi:RNA polymerase sigma-B factor
VVRLLPLAKRLAWRYSDRDEYDDLVQVASLGLLKAIDRFDPDRGLAFSTYAVPTIVGELKHYFRDYAWTVRVPRELHDRALHVRRAAEQLTAQLRRSPAPAEIADALDTSVELVHDALQSASALRPDRLDAPAGLDETTAEASATLAPLLARLTAREQQILSLRFEHDLTQSEIGALAGVSQMHVSRTLRTAIAALQQLAAEPPVTPLGGVSQTSRSYRADRADTPRSKAQQQRRRHVSMLAA